MPNNIYIDVTEDAEPPQWFDVQKTNAFLHALLKTCHYDNWELSVVFCSNDFIQNLNKQYRGLDEPTDVLSFPQSEAGEPIKPAFSDSSQASENADQTKHPFAAGDIVISFETLHKNAECFKEPEKQELRRLLVHGVLHLAGYDHQTNEACEPMLQLQEKILVEVTDGDI